MRYTLAILTPLCLLFIAITQGYPLLERWVVPGTRLATYHETTLNCVGADGVCTDSCADCPTYRSAAPETIIPYPTSSARLVRCAPGASRAGRCLDAAPLAPSQEVTMWVRFWQWLAEQRSRASGS